MLPATETPFDFSSGQFRYEAKLQLAPVIDLVLFLIWFYLLVGQLVMTQKDTSIELPQMSRAPSGQELPAEVVVNLRQDGQVTISGQDVRGELLEGTIRGELAKAQERKQSLRVVVRADRRQRYANLDDVLRSCRQAGVEQVVLRAEGGGLP